MDIDAVIAQATQEGAKLESEASKEAETVETPQESNETEVNEDAGQKPDSELSKEQLEKREANRRSHQNSREAKLRREVRELRELVSRMPSQPAQTQPANDGRPTKPDQSQFQDWDAYEAAKEEYYEKLADWKVEQKLSDRDKKSFESVKVQAEQATRNERVQDISKQTQEFAKKVPEYTQLIGEYAGFFEQIPSEVEAALLRAENTPLVVYALMKEGKLEALEDMDAMSIAMEIARAEIRGQSYLNQNRVTNAPDPIPAAKGTGSASRSMANMGVEDLMKRFNK